ncbi:hypothetical protein AMECASPLE_005156, partial [Ameca splendens]
HISLSLLHPRSLPLLRAAYSKTALAKIMKTRWRGTKVKELGRMCKMGKKNREPMQDREHWE